MCLGVGSGLGSGLRLGRGSELGSGSGLDRVGSALLSWGIIPPDLPVGSPLLCQRRQHSAASCRAPALALALAPAVAPAQHSPTARAIADQPRPAGRQIIGHGSAAQGSPVRRSPPPPADGPEGPAPGSRRSPSQTRGRVRPACRHRGRRCHPSASLLQVLQLVWTKRQLGSAMRRWRAGREDRADGGAQPAWL